VQVGKLSDEPSVYLFRKRVESVAGPQTCLHMCHSNVVIISGQSGTERCRGIALHNEPIGRVGDQILLDFMQHSGRQSAQMLICLHHFQVPCRPNSKQV
jgi:hypothetical protein